MSQQALTGIGVWAKVAPRSVRRSILRELGRETKDMKDGLSICGLPSLVQFAVSVAANSVAAIGDLNYGGKPDIDIHDYFGGSVVVFLNKGNGTFEKGVNYNVAPMQLARFFGDFNNDGRLDLATASCFSNDASVLPGKGDGTLQSPQNFPTQSCGLFAVAANFGGDGKLDLAVGNSNSNTVTILINNTGEQSRAVVATRRARFKRVSILTASWAGTRKGGLAARFGRAMVQRGESG
jgi:hypothetical protein